ncbi:MAG: hypothetical protein H0V17_04620 [Deltaproteobacteria bacterium]|nr:hypothetical protein [Deltaproteobacteria bacterium]
MRHYKHFNTTPEATEQCELALRDDGNFVWLISRSEADGGAVSHDARGHWTQSGDTITFEIAVRSSEEAPVPITATVVGDRLEIAGFGTFA